MLIVDMDLGDLSALPAHVQAQARAMAQGAAARLAAQTHAHIVEKAQTELHSTRETYVKNLYLKEEQGTWIVGLKKKARWIEDGMDQHEMIADLLKSSKTRTAKDGTRYLSVPFQHNKPPTQMTQAGQTLRAVIQEELKAVGVPWGKIEMGPLGHPRTGNLYRVDIVNRPKKFFEGAGQGWGPIGEVRQGPTGIPFLKGVRVYQRMVQQEAGAPIKVRREIMTFRTVSSLMMGSGRWMHPGLAPKNFFEEAWNWAQQEWVTKIKPEIIGR